MLSFIAKPFLLVILNYRRYRNKRIRTQVQSLSEVVYHDGHKLVHGNNIMAIREEHAVVRLVSQRYDKHPARSHHLHYIRVERKDQATAAKAIRLPGLWSVLQKLDA